MDAVHPERTVAYDYDPLGRLRTAATATWGLQWEHDRFGNRIAQVATAGSPPEASPAIDPATNRIAAAGFAYDAGGVASLWAGAALVHDAAGRLRSHSAGGLTASYGYDASGRRVRKTVDGLTTVYVYSGMKVLAEYVGGALSKEHVYAGSELIATRQGRLIRAWTDTGTGTTNGGGSAWASVPAVPSAAKSEKRPTGVGFLA